MSVPLIAIDDPQDERIAGFRSVRDADLRGRDHLFCVESPRIVRRFLHSLVAQHRGARTTPRLGLHSLLVTTKVREQLGDLLDEAIAAAGGDVPVHTASEQTMEQVAGYQMHKGALALGNRPQGATLEALLEVNSFDHLMVACGVVLTDNIGALMRNAGSIGSCGVLLAGGSSDPLHRKSIRISAGRVFSVPWAVSTDLASDIALLRSNHDFAVIAAENTIGARPIDDLGAIASAAGKGRMAVIMGAEGAGLHQSIIDLCDGTCAIEMRQPGGLIEASDHPSLNVAVASSIFLHRLGCARAHPRPTRLG